MKYAKKFSSFEDYMTWRTSSNYQIPSVVYCPEESTVVYHKFPVAAGYDYVDIALPSGTLWATMNIGAESSSDPGNYYSWAETRTKLNYSEEYYNYYSGSGQDYSKYNFSDGKQELEMINDAAWSVWGGEWHTPSKDQWLELLNYTTRTSGNGGITLTGDNGSSIFLPASGIMVGNALEDSSSLYYLSSGMYQASLRSGGADTDYCVVYYDNVGNTSETVSAARCNGFVVRPVIGKMHGMVPGGLAIDLPQEIK